jgi:hypothetical protein
VFKIKKMDISKQMRVGSTSNSKAIKTKMGTYAVNNYGWLICKHIVSILQSLYTGRKILKG